MKIAHIEELTARGINVPVITEVHDLLSMKRDGTITPQAPVIVTGTDLDLYLPTTNHLCLVCATHRKVLEVLSVYKCSPSQVIVVLPPLPPGEYHPAIRFFKAEGEEKDTVYLFPVCWTVPQESYMKQRLAAVREKNR